MAVDLLPHLLKGAIVTVELTMGAALVAGVLAFSAGLARLSNWPWLRLIAVSYIELFRGTSALVQVFFFFYVLPLMGINFSPILSGVLALGMNFGAYGSEIVRGAIIAVPKGQVEAAMALNMSGPLMMRRVVLPQAITLMLAPFSNLSIELLKATSLVSVITITELTFAGKILVQSTGRVTDVYLSVLIVYFFLALPLIVFGRYLERHVGIKIKLARPS
jgi:polar amino acid transport system permease protein